MAANTKVYAALDAGNGKVYDQKISDILNLEPRSSATFTIYLKPPANANTRVLVKIVSDDVLMDESQSDWFKT
ncbi:hypothetical protein N752_06665 [Desulforamulus aquiferis]|nr:hypothetical protein N752_06665 [Desulforamulus aquiferis]